MIEPPAAAPESAPAWHALTGDEVLSRLDADWEGLTTEEAEGRRARFGPNRLAPPRRRGPLMRLLSQFANVLIYVLLAAAAVTLALGEWIDSAVIAGVVVINALFGFIQEGRAERAIEAIRDMLSPEAAALRDGRRRHLPAEDLVPGDIVFLHAGDRVPADLRLLRARGLQAQEAALTGESVPVEKAVQPVPPDAALGDRAAMAYSGTLVTYGQGVGVVVATGPATEIGHISALLAKVEPLETPLLRQLATFGRWLSAAILALAAATFAYGWLVRGFGAADMFLAAVGLAVAAIPEGLPAILTITLAIGVQRMARHNAIVRRLPGVESLGSVTVICSDKTGTLTRNEMTVERIATGRHLFTVTGEGYDPAGLFRHDGVEADPLEQPVLMRALEGAVLCSDAGIRRTDGTWVVDGDPTEGALVTAAMKAGLDPAHERKACPRIDEIPFESAHRYMASLHHDHEGHGFVYLKGAPETVIALCDRQAGPDGDQPLDAAYWQRRAAALADQGYRVLALATRRTRPDHFDLEAGDVADGLALIALFGLLDPPRHEAIEAVAECRAAGVDVKMITGDHAGTARAVARALGLEHADAVMEGRDLDTLDGADLARRAMVADVFARTSPEHKLRLVEALQAAGLIVAMTGDGVNDAPALKRADIGVAMGLKGTDAAKEAAEMVLADDNFASIAHAVREGRAVYENLQKALAYILPTSFGEAFVIIAAVAAGSVLPITAVQILWINMITTVTLALAIAFEAPESDVMRRPPRRPDAPLLTGFLIWRVVLVTAIMVAGSYGIFLWRHGAGADLDTARTVAVNTIVLFEVFYLFNARHMTQSAFARGDGLAGYRPAMIASALVIGFQMLWTYVPASNLLFGSAPLAAGEWPLIVAVAASVLVLVEIEKAILRAFHARRGGGMGRR